MHPLTMPLWMILFLLFTNPFSFAGMPTPIVIGIVFINTFMFPVITILMMRKLGFVESLEMPDNKQRILPLVATIVFYVWAYLAIKKTNYPYMMMIFMMGALVSLFISFVINVFYKLSLHMVGISGVLMAVMIMLFFSQTDVSYYFLFIIILTGAIASARLYLKAHTLQEVYAGFLVGITGQILGLFVYHLF